MCSPGKYTSPDNILLIFFMQTSFFSDTYICSASNRPQASQLSELQMVLRGSDNWGLAAYEYSIRV